MTTESAALSEPATQVKAQLQSMDDYTFEHFVADLWAKRGFSAQVSQAAVDAGIDVIATKQTPYPQKELIQAKRYTEGNTVGGPDIQQYASLKHQGENVDSVVVVTTSSFTRHARERAADLNVKLVDGDDLITLIHDVGAQDLLTKYELVVESENEDRDEEPQPTDGEFEEVSVDTNLWLVGVACSGWALVGVFSALSLGTPSSVLYLSWFLLPVALVMDIRQIMAAEGLEWWFLLLCVIVGATPVLGSLVALYYLYLRLDIDVEYG